MQTGKEHAVTLFHRETSLVKTLNQSYFSKKKNKCPQSISGHQWDFPNSKAHASSAQCARLRVVPHFSSGIVERAKHARVKITPRAKRRHALGREKNEVLSPRRVSPFLAWDDFHARSRFGRSTIPEEK